MSLPDGWWTRLMWRHGRPAWQLDQYLPREVRRIIVGNYEMRYELVDISVYILRVWHTREER